MGWERGSKTRGHRYTYGSFTLLYSRNQYNIVKQLSSNLKKKERKLLLLHILNMITYHPLLLLLSCFSRVRLCATPKTEAHQTPQSLGLSRKEYWGSPGKNTGVGRHFLLQCMKVKSESEVAQSCPTPSDPMDCSLPGSSTHGILQARVLEWGAIAFSPKLLQFQPESQKGPEDKKTIYKCTRTITR